MRHRVSHCFSNYSELNPDVFYPTCLKKAKPAHWQPYFLAFHLKGCSLKCIEPGKKTRNPNLWPWNWTKTASEENLHAFPVQPVVKETIADSYFRLDSYPKGTKGKKMNTIFSPLCIHGFIVSQMPSNPAERVNSQSLISEIHSALIRTCFSLRRSMISVAANHSDLTPFTDI